MNYWLIKSEPDTFSWDDLKKRPKKTEGWDGVRNYQARNNMRLMKKGDIALFYHSSCKEPGIVGIATITREAYPDPTQFDEKSPYFDAKATPEKPRWAQVDITWAQDFKIFVSLQDLKATPALSSMKVVQKGQRLSVQPVTQKEFLRVCRMGGVVV